MDVIPVIDLKGGTVVHARLGQRDRYRPIETPLAATSDPVDVTRGLLSVFPFATLYVADLDCIGGTGDNRASLHRIRQAFPQLTLWVDNGIATMSAAAEWLGAGLGQLVLGSESQQNPSLVRRFTGDLRAVLSLDFRGDEFQGPPDLLRDTHCWPRRVIVMTLDRVGSHTGPDLDRLRAMQTTGSEVYAAGGVRDASDLRALKEAGIAGALVASSLHNGRVTAVDLRRLDTRYES
jgi:phosphoribosylformimino-5-aminoimidazole carboxamide ribotide isomerase